MLLTTCLQGFESYLIKLDKSAATIRSYLASTKLFVEYMQTSQNGPVLATQVKEEHVHEFLHDLRVRQGLKATTINTYLNGVRNLFKYAMRKEMITNDPTIYVESLKEHQERRDFLTAEEVQTLLGALQHELVNLVVRTLAYTGLRITECLSLELDDIDFGKGKLHVRNGKGGKPRTLPLHPELKEYLMQYKNGPRKYIKDSRYFFATSKSGKVSPAYVNRQLGKTVEKLKWEKHVTCHTLRHSFASLLVRNGTNLPTVAALLGHADFRTVTSVYVHIEHEELQQAVNQLSH